MQPKVQDVTVLRSGKIVNKHVTIAKTKRLATDAKKLKSANNQIAKKIFGKNVDKSA